MEKTKIGLGTAAIGRPQYINLRQGEKEDSEDLEKFSKNGKETLEAAHQLGVRYFDTAPGYGIAEQLIHQWLREKQHKDVTIATKWGYKYVANFDPKAEVHEVKDHSLELLNEQWDKSKKLLSKIVTLQIHSATFESGVLTNNLVLDRLAEIKETQGTQVGLTTSGYNQTEVLRAALDIHRNGVQLFEVFQVTYNVIDQSLAELRNGLEGKKLVIKEALANGRIFRNPHYQHYSTMNDQIERLAARYQVGVDAIAIRFCLDSIDPFVVLSGASNADQMKENLKADTFRLTPDEVEELKGLNRPTKEYWEERKQLKWN